MKKTYIIFTLFFFAGSLFASETWDILDKSMAKWNVNEGANYNLAWKTSQAGSGIAVTQKNGYVNITKTGTATSNNYAFLIPQTLALSTNTAYSFVVKARINPIDKGAFHDVSGSFESNQISARLNNKNMAIHVKYGDENVGYISLTGALSHSDENKYKINTSDWHVYRFVLYPDNSMYDIYIDDIEEPIFEDVPTSSMTGTNILRLGAESNHRCNMDIEYVKMGTGAFYAKPKIVSVDLSAGGQGDDKTETIITTVNTILIADNEKLLISLVDSDDRTVVNAVEAVIMQSKAEVNFTVPAGLPRGKYFVKAAAPSGKIGDIDIIARKAEYLITSSAYEGKNLAVFGNSITVAANSWAYQIHRNLRFGNIYNGAMSAALWYKRERVVAGQTIRTQNYYDDDFAGIRTSAPTEGNVLENQQRINNCAIVHLQKYFIELDKNAVPTPDVIIFSYGTNDEVINMGDAEPALQGDDLNQVNIFTMAGALRWCLDTMKIKFPDAKIYVALALQSTRTGQNSNNLKKMEIIKTVCDAKSVPYFDCYNESGITVENHVTYLSDGLHPNEAGKVVHGAYIMKKLEEYADNETGLPPVFRKEAGDELVSVSTSMLNKGQTLSVKSLKSNTSLAELMLYSIGGNTIYRQLASGSDCTFNVPTTAGLYLLSVRLENKLSKEFKILVK